VTSDAQEALAEITGYYAIILEVAAAGRW